MTALRAHVRAALPILAVASQITCGNTGNTSNIPHLHFSVQACDPVTGGSAACPSLPATFRNTDPNPQGLGVGRVYPAYPY